MLRHYTHAIDIADAAAAMPADTLRCFISRLCHADYAYFRRCRCCRRHYAFAAFAAAAIMPYAVAADATMPSYAGFTISPLIRRRSLITLRHAIFAITAIEMPPQLMMPFSPPTAILRRFAIH